MVINRFEIYFVSLDPTIGAEIKKIRPCVIVSPNEMNHHISTVIIAPMTTMVKNYPTRIQCKFKGKEGNIVLDQVRTVDKKRLIRKVGILDISVQKSVLKTLLEMFSP